MKKLIFLKMFGASLAIIILLVVAILVTSFGFIRARTLDGLAADLEKLGRALEPDVTDYIDRNALADMEAYFRKFEQQTRVRLTFIRPDGTVAADSQEKAALMESHRYRPEVVEALQGRTGRALRFSDTLGQEMLYIAVPVVRDGRLIGCLRMSNFSRDIDAILSGLKRSITLTAALVAALALILAFLLSRSYTRSIHRMIEASDRIASGDFKAKVYIRNRDELGQLAASLNAMSDRIRVLFGKVTAQQEEIQGIIGAMEEGLLVVKPDERISLANPSFRRIFDQSSPEGKYYWEAVRNTGFNTLIQKAREEQRPMLDRLSIQDRTYLVHASYIPAIGHVAATLHDITDIISFERLKRDFVANVSHELQTPLTAIKGYAETMEPEADETGREYLKVILRNTDRLIAIVKDLLLLSELEDIEDRTSPPVLDPVDMTALIESLFKVFEPKARAKGLFLTFNAPPGALAVSGDAFKLEQMVINLLDNAFKYTDQGGITVSLRSDPPAAVLEFEDTGLGIAPEHLPRIFERFYVVDKSRLRNMGGTGLGLSIVKHIVQMHKGEISLVSRLGRGTKFTIRFPLAPAGKPVEG
ncbi:MAG: hypothetical protein A2Y56_01620 [Candidatus Aminicenantes bacterium RBG_13_63_10]|nr:MAG: hypothetical protein A2Y56_01620 [Candidatus Aminicenantes bacterium RBG_13_63_10]